MSPTISVPITISSQGYELVTGSLKVELATTSVPVNDTTSAFHLSTEGRPLERALAAWLMEIAAELEAGDDQ